MLTVYDKNRRYGRRDFLRIGSLGLGGLSLSGMLQAQSDAAAGKALFKDKSVIFLFMHGGPSQTETFDPKMTAPVGVRAVTGETPTTLPGVTFGSTFTKLAAMADKLSVVRSYRSGDARHDIKPIVHSETLNANMGSLYARVAGTNDPVTGMPTNAALYPQAVDPTTRPTTMNFGKFNSTGELGSAYAPFVPGGGGTLQEDMKLTMPQGRLDDRRTLLSRLDRIKRDIDTGGSLLGMDHFQEQAFNTILGGVAEAFDLSKEDPRVLERYDTAPLMRPEDISPKWNNYNNYVDNAKSLGKLLLLARRLCERGCRFITITTNFVWDMHADVNNATIEEGMQYMGKPFDHAVSAFIEDVHARSMSNDILLVCSGEMGRTPKVNARGGRDHWGNLTPLLLSGGGLQMGNVIGQSTRDAGEPFTEPQGISNLLATIMHTMLDPGRLRITRGVPTEVIRAISNPTPIPGLL